MSQFLFEEDIRFLQRFATIAGAYTGSIDGKWNSSLDSAEAKMLNDYRKIRSQMGELDARSEKNIGTLLPAAQKKARSAMEAVKGGALTYKIISGTRTYDEQDILYAQGRTKPGKIVTLAKGGHSNHNFGIAWDIGIFENGNYFEGENSHENKAYIEASKLILDQVSGIEWGGNWTNFIDKPHYQLDTGKATSEVRHLFEQGRSFA